VPALEHNGKILGESLDLIKYVDASFEGTPLFPTVRTKHCTLLLFFSLHTFSYHLFFSCWSRLIMWSWNYFRILRRKSLVSNWYPMLIHSPETCSFHWKEMLYKKPVSAIFKFVNRGKFSFSSFFGSYNGDLNQVLLLNTWRMLLVNLMMAHSCLVNSVL